MSRYVGVEMTFTNKSRKPEPISLAAPGATASYCVLLNVKSGDKVIEIDWSSIDTDNDQASWLVP
jgi:hypothetical protein